MLQYIIFIFEAVLCLLPLIYLTRTVPRVCEHSRLLRKQLIEENKQAFELERRCLSELQLAAKPFSHRPYYGYSVDALKLPEGSSNL